MPLLVDGHNLIGQMPDLSLSDPNDEEKLIARLRILTEREHKRITVVFDPNPHDDAPRLGHGKSQHGLLSVMYAHPGHKADDLIRQIVGETKDRQGLTVVTSDAAVADFTRRCGVRVQSSADFLRWMNGRTAGRRDANAKPLGNAREVVNWADVFAEPEPTPHDYKPLLKPKEKKGKKRSEQLKNQVRKTKPLF